MQCISFELKLIVSRTKVSTRSKIKTLQFINIVPKIENNFIFSISRISFTRLFLKFSNWVKSELIYVFVFILKVHSIGALHLFRIGTSSSNKAGWSFTPISPGVPFPSKITDIMYNMLFILAEI